MQRREKFDLGDFDLSTVAVIHRWGADVLRTRRRWPYMQHGTGRYPHLGTVRDNTNALASTGQTSDWVSDPRQPALDLAFFER